MKRNKLHLAVVVTAVVVVTGSAACATPGAEPHDMSAKEHAAMAARAEAEAAQHDAQFDPGASVDQIRCGVRGACWTSTKNPTDSHRRAAASLRKQAADHRAGSEALRAAEASACVGISDEDRDMSPFEHVEDIASVSELTEQVTVGKTSHQERRGAVVTFRALPGMTAEWLQRVVDCHLARNAALGHVVREMPSCPLVPKGAQAKVSSTGSGFAVAIRADDRAAADEVYARARGLLSPPAVSSTH